MDTLRKPKILDMSIFDWMTTLLGRYLISVYLLNLHKVESIILFQILFQTK